LLPDLAKMHCSPEDSLGEPWTGEKKHGQVKKNSSPLLSQAKLGELFFTHLTFFPFKHLSVSWIISPLKSSHFQNSSMKKCILEKCFCTVFLRIFRGYL
jgi:hypothetical protein